MPACARTLSIAAALLAACSQPSTEFGFAVDRVDSQWRNGRLTASFHQQLGLSDEAREALVHGVPLTLELELILRNTRDQTHVSESTRRYGIHYLPLSDHYQLSGPGEGDLRTFPRLRHVLAELSDLDVSIDTGPLPRGEYEVIVRFRLDRRALPPPMRLPVWLSPHWRHDSDWSAWPIEIDPRA